MFCKVHIIGPIDVYSNFDINRYNIDEFRKHAKIVFYVTSRDAKRYVVRHSGMYTPERYFDQEHCVTNQKSLRSHKSYGSNSGFYVMR